MTKVDVVTKVDARVTTYSTWKKSGEQGKGYLALVTLWARLIGLTSNSLQGQFLGDNFRGDFGVLSGSQPDPALYFAPMYVRYDANTLRNRFGGVTTQDL